MLSCQVVIFYARQHKRKYPRTQNTIVKHHSLHNSTSQALQRISLKSIKLKKHFLSRHYPSVSILHPLWAFCTIKGADNVLIWAPTQRCTMQKQDLSSYMYILIYTRKGKGWGGEERGVYRIYIQEK